MPKSEKIRITFFYHNAFLLDFKNESWLFDCPLESYLPTNVQEKVLSAIKGKNLKVFSSHSHGDHFCPSILKLSKWAEQCEFYLSDDIRQTFPELDSEQNQERIHWLKEDSEYSFPTFSVKTLKSNDLGVAFLCSIPTGQFIYFGGDLAEWDWPGMSQQEASDIFEPLQKGYESLLKIPLSIAFSNCDRRLENYSGAISFVEKFKPRYFIPMHTFSDCTYLDMITFPLAAETQVWTYKMSGDFIDIEI